MKQVKVVANRDSATAILRKLGISKANYGNFIDKKDGEFHINIAAAKESLLAATGGLRMVERQAEKKEEIMEELKEEVKEELKEELKAEIKQEIKSAVKKRVGATGKKPILMPVPAGKSKITVKGAAKRTVSSVIRELIYQGKTNKEIWDLVQAEFNLSADKKWYPAWYRSDLKRSGKLK